MRFGVSWVPDEMGTYAEVVRRTEEAGFDRIGVPDTQAAGYRECYVTLTHLFGQTRSIKAGPLVTNPVTRHPAITAAAIATADELSGGRATLTLSTGDTGVFNLGLKPAKLAQLEEYVVAVRELFESGQATWHGNVMKLKWVERSVPIYLAADGPKALRLAGKIADGVVVGLGFTESVIPLVERYVSEGAAEAGRSVDDIDIWYMARVAVADDRASALDLVRPSIAAGSAHAFRFSLEGKGVPEGLEGAVRELEQRYDHTVHNIPGTDNPNGRLLEELGLTEHLADRMGVIGTQADCIEKIERLRAMGVENLFIRPLVVDRLDFLDRWGRIMAAIP